MHWRENTLEDNDRLRGIFGVSKGDFGFSFSMDRLTKAEGDFQRVFTRAARSKGSVKNGHVPRLR